MPVLNVVVSTRQMGGLDALDEPLTSPGKDREDPEVELVDEVVCHERPVELARAELQDVPPGCCLSLATSSATSPLTTVAFQVASRSVRDATYFGRLLMRSE